LEEHGRIAGAVLQQRRGRVAARIDLHGVDDDAGSPGVDAGSSRRGAAVIDAAIDLGPRVGAVAIPAVLGVEAVAILIRSARIRSASLIGIEV
jgi:hypothetical protein